MKLERIDLAPLSAASFKVAGGTRLLIHSDARNHKQIAIPIITPRMPNHHAILVSCPGTLTFIPKRPVIRFSGTNTVPIIVTLPSISVTLLLELKDST